MNGDFVQKLKMKRTSKRTSIIFFYFGFWSKYLFYYILRDCASAHTHGRHPWNGFGLPPPSSWGPDSITWHVVVGDVSNLRRAGLAPMAYPKEQCNSYRPVKTTLHQTYTDGQFLHSAKLHCPTGSTV